jgi:hypothetical protein
MARTLYDLEALLADVEAVLKANLPSQLTAIDSEKNDGITLKQIDNAAYFAQTLNQGVAAYDPYLAYGVIDQSPDGNYGGTADRISIQVVIVLSDPGQDPSVLKRILRYQRALRQVFESNWEKTRKNIKIRVEPTLPVQLTELDTSKSFRAVGVQIETQLPY